MIYTHAAAAIIAASLAGWAGWSVQGWRLGEQIAALKTAQAEAVNTATREARAQESARFKGVQDAQAAAAKQAQLSKRAADAARSESRSLRDDLNAAHEAASQSLTACNQHSATVGRLLEQCAGAYQDMAETAQGHANDVSLLLSAWPK